MDKPKYSAVALATMIENHDWDAHLSIRLHSGIPPDQVHQRIVKEVLLPLEHIAAQKIPALGIVTFNEQERRHAHYVLHFSKTSPDLLKLLYLNHRLLSRKSIIINHKGAIWITPYVRAIHPTYLANHYNADASIEMFRQIQFRSLDL